MLHSKADDMLEKDLIACRRNQLLELWRHATPIELPDAFLLLLSKGRYLSCELPAAIRSANFAV